MSTDDNKFDAILYELIDSLLNIEQIKNLYEINEKKYEGTRNVNPLNMRNQRLALICTTIEEIIKDKDVLSIFSYLHQENMKILSGLEKRAQPLKTNAEILSSVLQYMEEHNNFYNEIVPKHYIRAFELIIEKHKNGENIFLKRARAKSKVTLNPVVSNDLLKVTQTAGMSDLLYSLIHVTKDQVDDFFSDKQSYVTEKDGQIAINLTDLSSKTATLTENHFKLLVYTFHKHCITNDFYTEIQYKEYFELKGINDNKDNREKLRKELQELDAMFFDFRYKDKRNWKWLRSSRVLAIMGRNRNGITVSFGDWHKHIDKKTFIEIDNNFFKYQVTRNTVGASTLSFKLRELNNMDKKSVKVSVLTKLLDIKDSTLSGRGFHYVVEKLQKELTKIQQAEGLQWKLRNEPYSNLSSFENDYIDFTYNK